MLSPLPLSMFSFFSFFFLCRQPRTCYAGTRRCQIGTARIRTTRIRTARIRTARMGTARVSRQGVTTLLRTRKHCASQMADASNSMATLLTPLTGASCRARAAAVVSCTRQMMTALRSSRKAATSGVSAAVARPGRRRVRSGVSHAGPDVTRSPLRRRLHRFHRARWGGPGQEGYLPALGCANI